MMIALDTWSPNSREGIALSIGTHYRVGHQNWGVGVSVPSGGELALKISGLSPPTPNPRAGAVVSRATCNFHANELIIEEIVSEVGILQLPVQKRAAQTIIGVVFRTMIWLSGNFSSFG